MPVARLFLVVFTATALLTACGGPSTLAPQPVATPAGESIASDDTPIPLDQLAIKSPEEARDAALAHIANQLSDQQADVMLPAGEWQETGETPPGLVGSDRVSYRAGDWLVRVQAPVVRPDLVVYEVVAMDKLSGFIWQGRVHAASGIVEEGDPASS